MRTSFAQDSVSQAFRWIGGTPAFRILGRADYEPAWRTIDVFATCRRNAGSRWPLWRGHCTTLTANVIAVGWDFAEFVVAEQTQVSAALSTPVRVKDGRIRRWARSTPHVGAVVPVTASEILAHECGHTAQAIRMGWLYWPIGAVVTLFREGPHWWQQFENQASETGLFGGIIPGSLDPLLDRLLKHKDAPTGDQA